MKKQIVSWLACVALLVLAIPDFSVSKSPDGYKLTGDARTHKCPKGKYWSNRDHTCVSY